MKLQRTLPSFLLTFLALSAAAAAEPEGEEIEKTTTPSAPSSSSESPEALEDVTPQGAPQDPMRGAAGDHGAPSAPNQSASADSPQSESASPRPATTTTTATTAITTDPPKVIKAEFGKGFTIGTADEKLTLNIRGRLQVQGMASDGPNEGDEVTQIQARRMRLVFQGKLFADLLQYYFQLAFSNRDQEPDLRTPLRDAYITYAPLRDLNLRFGQMKVPYGRQRVTSSSAQGMVDRSIVTTELNLDRDVGVYAFSKDVLGLGESLGYSVGVFGGDGRNRLAENAGLLYFARLNLRPLGGFEDNSEGGFEFEPKPKLAVGLSAAYNQATNRPNSTTGLPYADDTVFFDYAHLGADFMFKWHGFYATGEWMLRAAAPEELPGEDADGDPFSYVSRQAWGAYGQIGQMLTEHLELSARYGHLEPIGSVSAVPMTHEIGGGVSYYFFGHNLKMQADYFYLSNQSNWSAGTNQGRLQAQVYF